VSDMQYSIKTLELTDVLTVVADIPFISVEIVDRAVAEYRSSGKPSLAVMAPADVYKKIRSEPEHVFEIDERRLVPIGLNVIDGRRIDEPELDQTVLVTDVEEHAVNVNTPIELEEARQRLVKTRGADTSEKSSFARTPKTYRLARIGVFSALSVVGSFIHPPTPIQSAAFDSSPGFFAALYFGAADGALVSGIGHVVTAIINGFPLGVLHLPIALGMAAAGAAMGLINRLSRRAYFAAALAAVAINTGLVVVVVPVLGWGAALSFLPFLLLAAVLNALIAVLAYVGVRGRLRL